ncbi:MAG: IPTL-CTERM sorting domain-containing protein [Planctomycetes bacterium]|nr:IPTL-CTERM sorting domain-containing protein [Planctomycetota bacterium]
MKSRIRCISLALASSLFAAGSAFAQTPTLSLQAVKVNDVALTPSSSITVKPGDTIVAEIFVSDWSPDGERLLSYQTGLSRDVLVSGTSGSVRPLGWDAPIAIVDTIGCVIDDDCTAEFPFCEAGAFFCIGPNHDPSQGVFIGSPSGALPNRPDWVFINPNTGASLASLAVVDFRGPVLRYGAVLINFRDAQTYAPPPKYCGTLRLQVSDDASGTFAIELDPTQSELRDERIIPIVPLTLLGLTIEIDPCGNGMIDAGEACDDGTSNSDTVPDGCRTDCSLPACGDNVKDSSEQCDGEDLGDCPGSCADDCTCLPVEIPTVSAWGLAAFTLLLLAAGRVYFGRRFTRRLVS